MPLTRRALLSTPLLPGLAPTARAQGGGPIRFAVGPFQPTAGDTRRVYQPVDELAFQPKWSGSMLRPMAAV